jgi:hypothetical protein
MNYAKQSSKPKWFDEDQSKLYHSATSGTSFLNEWYEFEDREDALKYMFSSFEHQTFIDEFTFCEDGELYYEEDTIFDEDNSIFNPKDGAKPVDIGNAVWAESSF